MAITINKEQRLFVIPIGKGYSCFGFDNCYKDACVMALKMQVEPPDAISIGTIACYNAYRALCNQFAEHKASKETWFTPGTDVKVEKVLSRAFRSHQGNK